jgi:hypothetical protein
LSSKLQQISGKDREVHSAGHASLEELLAVDDTGEEEEFAPAAGTDVDDETTFEAEEKLGRDMTYEEEIAMLQNEGEMPIEQLRAMYASVNNESEVDEEMESEEDVSAEDTAGSVLHELAAAQVDDGENDEFEPTDGDAVDDETTMDAEGGKILTLREEISLRRGWWKSSRRCMLAWVRVSRVRVMLKWTRAPMKRVFRMVQQR